MLLQSIPTNIDAAPARFSLVVSYLTDLFLGRLRPGN
jgi:hypothetical protein